ncbi:HD domain-containing protein, partial [Escherichia coli]|nr:HD domain-containing protein [Escherichia coli]
AELGRRIELSDIQQSKLALLCLLHDIGKVGVPMEILNKPGKLTDEEWKIMRSHVEKGYEIAMSNTELRQIAEEIRHHHERWD